MVPGKGAAGHLRPAHGQRDGLLPGADGFDLPDKLKILPSDLHIVKTYGNSFNKTPLEEELRKLGVDTVIITGFCAEYCVLATDRGARDIDLTPIILRGSLASVVAENIRFVESISDVISFEALKKVLAENDCPSSGDRDHPDDPGAPSRVYAALPAPRAGAHGVASRPRLTPMSGQAPHLHRRVQRLR